MPWLARLTVPVKDDVGLTVIAVVAVVCVAVTI